MTPRERGFLLLCSRLGDPQRQVLSASKLRALSQRVQNMERPAQDRELTREDLRKLGFSGETADRILSLLDDGELLEQYIRRGRKLGCEPVSRVSADYPPLLCRRLGMDRPACLWAKGDLKLLKAPAIALVGSRDLREENHKFAAAVGRHAAQHGLVLISGNARGADRTAQRACLNAGGSVISIVADQLSRQILHSRILYLSEEDFDAPFSVPRALSRNRCIHALGQMVFVAQSDLGKGGSWDGTVRNLRHGWSPVLCFRDGSEASLELEQRGAYLIGLEELEDFSSLPAPEQNFFDP